MRLMIFILIFGAILAGCSSDPLYSDASPQLELARDPYLTATQSSPPPIESPEDEAIIRAAMAAEENSPLVQPINYSPPQIAENAPYLLDSGDRLRLFVYGQPNLSRTYNVDGGGFISVPLIGAVRARNLTTYDLEREITRQLAAKYVRDPKVSVEISVYRPFFILGEVRRPGQYPFVNGMNVETAVAIAGGFSARAYQKSVKLTRIVNGYRTTVKVAPDTPVFPGDTIRVRERFF